MASHCFPHPFSLKSGKEDHPKPQYCLNSTKPNQSRLTTLMVALQKEERGGQKRLEMGYSTFSHSHHQDPGPTFTRSKFAEPTGSDTVPPPAEEMPRRVESNLAL